MNPQSNPLSVTANCSVEEVERINAREMRRLYLYGPIYSLDEDGCGYLDASAASKIVEYIIDFNRADIDIPPEKREPIIMYINSPGGDMTEGFSIISAMEISKTPVYTVNVGEWSSMAFLIGITGKKRYTLPYSTFLFHDGFAIAGGTTSMVKDKVEFDKRFEEEIIKEHVLRHSNLSGDDYDALARVEFYMLPKDAKEKGFVDEIVTNIDEIL